MRNDVRAEMVDYDQVRERACISFINSKGQPVSLWIHKTTFLKLMIGPWDASRLGEPNLLQRDLREALKMAVKGKFDEWFDTTSNDILKLRATGKA